MRDARRRERFFVQSVSSLFHALGEWMRPEADATRHESVFFDDALLTLGGDARAIARRRLEDDASRSEGECDFEMTQIEIGHRGRVALSSVPEPRESIERSVLADMRAIRDALTKRHGVSITRTTERSWLKKIA